MQNGKMRGVLLLLLKRYSTILLTNQIFPLMHIKSMFVILCDNNVIPTPSIFINWLNFNLVPFSFQMRGVLLKV